MFGFLVFFFFFVLSLDLDLTWIMLVSSVFNRSDCHGPLSFSFMYFRVESTYRTWVHAKKDDCSIWNCEELGRDLRTALGTTKWQVISPLVSFPAPTKISLLFIPLAN